MAGLNILRVFLVVLLLCLMETNCKGLVNEDYYSFEEDPINTENAATTITQNTWPDATSESAINIMEADVGSGEADINQTDKATDLSTDRYLFAEDLPSAEEIFKAIDNESVEITTKMSDLETTKNEHIKQIFEKLGVTKEELFGAVTTEAVRRSGESEQKEVSAGFGEDVLVMSAPVNGNLQISNVLGDDKDYGFFENNKELEEEIINDKEENALGASNEDKKLQLSEETKFLPNKDSVKQIEEQNNFAVKTEMPYITTMSEINYENYYGSDYEEKASTEIRLATVDPALYEYEARSSEEDSTFSTTIIEKTTVPFLEEIFSSPTTTESSRETQTVFASGFRENKDLDFEENYGISDKLDFDSSTISEEPILEENNFESMQTTIFASTTEKIVQTTTENFEPTTEISIESALKAAKELSNEGVTKHGFDETLKAAFVTEKRSVLDDVITTHTPTTRIFAESVNLVTENSDEDANTQIDLCLKLNFTGRIETKESTIAIPNNASVFGSCHLNEVFVNITWQTEQNAKVNIFFNFTENLLTNIQLNLQQANNLFEQSKRVKLMSTNQEVNVEFENHNALVLTFFEFSTRYNEDVEPVPSSEELQRGASFLLEIVGSCVGLVLVIAVVGFYGYKRYRGRSDNFKPEAAA